MKRNLPLKAEKIRKNFEIEIKKAVKERGEDPEMINVDDSLMQQIARCSITTEFFPLADTRNGVPPTNGSENQALIAQYLQFETRPEFKNIHSPVSLFGANNSDVSSPVFGNVRQRFWQNAYFNLYLNSDQGGTKHEKQLIPFNPQNELGQLEPEDQEIYGWIYQLQAAQAGYLFMSMPNSEYQLEAKPSSPVARSGVRLPDNIKGTGARGPDSDVRFYQPYYSYMVRTYHFKDQTEFMKTPLWDIKTKTIHLNGIVGIGNQLVIPEGWKYTGNGVLYAYGSIFLKGSLLPVNPLADSCCLYSDGGEIVITKPAKIEASLIALNMFYPKKKGKINFSGLGNEINVKGNVAVDELNSPMMANKRKNRIYYDSPKLNRNQEELFYTYLGGQVRRRSMFYDVKDE